MFGQFAAVQPVTAAARTADDVTPLAGDGRRLGAAGQLDAVLAVQVESRGRVRDVHGAAPSGLAWGQLAVKRAGARLKWTRIVLSL